LKTKGEAEEFKGYEKPLGGTEVKNCFGGILL
jgi:hypothetical protein